MSPIERLILNAGVILALATCVVVFMPTPTAGQGNPDLVVIGALPDQPTPSLRIIEADGNHIRVILGSEAEDTLIQMQVMPGTRLDWYAVTTHTDARRANGDVKGEYPPSADRVLGSAYLDEFWLGCGEDFIQAGPGDDRVYAGCDDDIVHGNQGHDILHGGRGQDLIRGGHGDDIVYGGRGDDTIYAGYGRDWVLCGLGLDVATGGPGIDRFFDCEVILDLDEAAGERSHYTQGKGAPK
jgi:Ca2+-binding RTX toxin-like protein